MSKYQIWYNREWSLTMPSANKEMVLRYARNLRKAYGKDGENIKVRKVN